MANFLTQSRFFSKALTIRMPALYLFDLLLLLIIVPCVWMGGSDLHGFGTGAAGVEASSHDFALLGAVGLYGMRLSTWLAVLRHNRMPQTGEWLATLIGFAILFFCIIFSSPLTQAYASAHGYRLCGPVFYHRETTLMFARSGATCPPRPKGGE